MISRKRRERREREKHDLGLTMVSLRIATKATQSLILPSLLVASWVNELDPEHIVELLFEDVATLPDTENAVALLDCGDNGTASGTKDVIKKLIAQYQVLPSRPQADVSQTSKVNVKIPF